VREDEPTPRLGAGLHRTPRGGEISNPAAKRRRLAAANRATGAGDEGSALDVCDVVQPIKFFRTQQHRYGDGHIFAPRSRFLPDDILPLFTRMTAPMAVLAGNTSASQSVVSIDIAARLRGMWADA
jgi:hypothetical protein